MHRHDRPVEGTAGWLTTTEVAVILGLQVTTFKLMAWHYPELYGLMHDPKGLWHPDVIEVGQALLDRKQGGAHGIATASSRAAPAGGGDSR